MVRGGETGSDLRVDEGEGRGELHWVPNLREVQKSRLLNLIRPALRSEEA